MMRNNRHVVDQPRAFGLQPQFDRGAVYRAPKPMINAEDERECLIPDGRIHARREYPFAELFWVGQPTPRR
jgi:hypothetical protein